MESISLVLPYPVSSNRYWRKATRVIRGKRQVLMLRTIEAEAFIREVRRAAAAARGTTAWNHQPLAGRVALTAHLYPARPRDWKKRVELEGATWDDGVRCIDVGNCEKVMSDALQGIVIADDKQIRRITLERMTPDDLGARLEVTVAPWS